VAVRRAMADFQSLSSLMLHIYFELLEPHTIISIASHDLLIMVKGPKKQTSSQNRRVA
jgi:hypothetical protein